MSRRTMGLVALVIAAVAAFALPSATLGANNLRPASVKQTTKQTTEALRNLARRTGARLNGTRSATKKSVKGTGLSLAGKIQHVLDEARGQRAAAADPQIEPPLRGTNPHGQGSVAVVDLNPSAERPQPDSTVDHKSGEEIIAGRSRGEQLADGSFRGHITILELFGNELVGVNTTNGQTRHGPLEPLQQGVLDPLCDGSGNQVCLSVLTADSTTNATGSTNDFAVARAQLGGATGLGVGAAESHGAIAADGACQNAASVTKTANVAAGPGVVAGAANSASAARQCPGAAETVTQTSQVLNLGGTAVPLPAAGCGQGTPDTRFGPLAPVATIVCNAEGLTSSGVRQALDVYALSTGGTSLAQESTAQSESHAVAAAATPQCADGTDNDGDGQIDFPADKGCTSAQDDSEAGGTPQCSDGRDNDGDGKVDFPADKGCTSALDTSEAGGGVQCDDGVDNDNDGTTDYPDDKGCSSARDTSERASGSGRKGAGTAQCADGVDNDGDGVIDAADPGCHSDGDAGNKASYDPSDDSEASGAGGLKGGSLAFTGADVGALVLAGLFMLAGGMLLRRREELPS